MSLPWLSESHQFPPVSSALPDGLLASGGDLSPERLLSAYRQGIFPWFNVDNPILWWSPDPRMVLIPEQIAISKSLKRTLKKQPYTVSIDQAFTAVMSACAQPRDDDVEAESSTWIHPDMITAYTQLHQQGHAHSVECWAEGRLVGGLYGVAIGRIFFGESMFSFARDSSKIALVTLCQQLQQWGVPLIDCQLYSAHLASMGAIEIDRDDFIAVLDQFCPLEPLATSWQTIQS